jgi:DNA/RNA endonuclease YhcR with UshA esterase domain
MRRITTLGLVIAFAYTTASSVALAKESEITAMEASNHLGETAAVTGKVEDVYQAKGGNIFLNLDGRHPNAPFTVFIGADKADQFKEYRAYLGKTITVTGKIQEHQKKTEVAVTSPSQIVVKEEGSSGATSAATSPAASASPASSAKP